MTNTATPKTVLPQATLAQLDLEEIGRIVLCSSGLEVVHSRDKENTSGRPGRKKAPQNKRARAMKYSMRFWKTSAVAVGKTRPTAPEEELQAHRRAQERRRRTRGRESGSARRADPQAALLGMRKRLASEKGRKASAGRMGCPRGADEEDPRGGGIRLFDPEVEVEC